MARFHEFLFEKSLAARAHELPIKSLPEFWAILSLPPCPYWGQRIKNADDLEGRVHYLLERFIEPFKEASDRMHFTQVFRELFELPASGSLPRAA